MSISWQLFLMLPLHKSFPLHVGVYVIVELHDCNDRAQSSPLYHVSIACVTSSLAYYRLCSRIKKLFSTQHNLKSKRCIKGKATISAAHYAVVMLNGSAWSWSQFPILSHFYCMFSILQINISFREQCKRLTMALMNVHLEWQLVAVNTSFQCATSISDVWYPQPSWTCTQCMLYVHCNTAMCCLSPLCSCSCTQLAIQCIHLMVLFLIVFCPMWSCSERLLTWVAIMMSYMLR